MKNKISIFLITCVIISGLTAGAATVSHSPSEITPGTFASGDYLIPGNVGIGSTSPGAKLHIKATDNSWSAGIKLEDDATSNRYNIIFDDRLRIGYNELTMMAMDSSGNIGIGTPGPSQKLDVVGNVNAQGLCIAGDCISNWASVSGTGGWTDDGTNVRLTASTDKVGIGTNTPSTKLSVDEPSNANALVSIGSGLTLPQFSAIDFYDRGTNKWGIGKDAGNKFYIDEYGAGNRLTILPGGNVGIGTTSPNYKLSIVNSAAQPQVLIGSDQSGNMITIDSAVGSGLGNIVSGAYWNGANYIYGGTRGASRIYLNDGSLHFYTGGASGVEGNPVTFTERLQLDNIGNVLMANSGGNVGIGTSSPTEKLDVIGRVKGTELCIGADCRSTWPTGGSSQWTTSSSDIYYATGNVGIGTISPGAPLDVAPVAGIRTGTAAKNIALFTAGGGNDIQSTGGTLYFNFNRAQALNFLNGFVVLTTAGDVGIGTASPSYKLDVAGQIRSSSGGFVFPDASIQTTAISNVNTRVFTKSGTFTIPAGVTRITVDVWGGGGGGAGGMTSVCWGYGGGGGGFGRGIFTVIPGNSYVVTVGSGGSGTAFDSGIPGGAGGTSSFEALISATGGGGGTCWTEGAGGTSAASINFPGSSGSSSGAGGDTGGADGYGSGLGAATPGLTAEAPGGGGSGSGSTVKDGLKGAHGKVAVYW